MCSSLLRIASTRPGDQDGSGLSSSIESIIRSFSVFSPRKVDRVAPNKFTEFGFINYPTYLNEKKTGFTWSGNKRLF